MPPFVRDVNPPIDTAENTHTKKRQHITKAPLANSKGAAPYHVGNTKRKSGHKCESSAPSPPSPPLPLSGEHQKRIISFTLEPTPLPPRSSRPTSPVRPLTPPHYLPQGASLSHSGTFPTSLPDGPNPKRLHLWRCSCCCKVGRKQEEPQRRIRRRRNTVWLPQHHY